MLIDDRGVNALNCSCSYPFCLLPDKDKDGVQASHSSKDGVHQASHSRSVSSIQSASVNLAQCRAHRNIRPPLRFNDATPSTSRGSPTSSQGSSQKKFKKRSPTNQSIAGVSQQLEAGQATLSGITQMLQTAIQPLQSPMSQIFNVVQGIQQTVEHINKTTIDLQKDISQLKVDVNTMSARQVIIVDQQRRSRNLMKRIWDQMQDDGPVVDVKRSHKQLVEA